MTKQYMQTAEVFADACNCLIYDGEPVIKPEQLHELDTTAMATLYSESGEGTPVQVYRDLLKYAAAMEDGRLAYLILGIENQTAVHYAMPVRNWLYDALQYYRQIQETAGRHRKNKTDRKPTREEYLSGFYRTDKLMPVVTLVVYFGTKPWDGPKSLYEMLDIPDEKVLACVADYKINLLDPASMSDESIGKLKSELKNVFYYIKYAGDSEKLQKLMETDSSFQSLNRATAELLNVVTQSKLTLPEGEEKINMCKAIQDMRAESMAIGESRGIAIGESRGIAIGESRGKFDTLFGLVKDGLLTAAQASERVNLTEAQFVEKMAENALT